MARPPTGGPGRRNNAGLSRYAPSTVSESDRLTRPSAMMPNRLARTVLGAIALAALGYVGCWMSAPEASASVKPPRLAGMIEAVEGSPGSIRVAGWALDLRGPSGVGVAIAVDRTWTLVPAGGFRYDLWRLFPRSGPRHGFDVRLPATPGPHFVCVVAAGGGLPNRLLGCRLVNAGPPATGVIDDAVVLAADQVTLSGWAVYPLAPDPVDLRVTVDGIVAGGGRAGGSRPDLAGAFPLAGPGHGYRLTVVSPPGRHTVCINALVAGGAGTQQLACRIVDVPWTQPRGVLESVWTDGSDVMVAGWTDDPDAAGPINVRVSVTHDRVGDPATVVATAADPRPDVGSSLGVDAHRGFVARVPGIAAGVRTVCAAALNQRLGEDRLLGCTTVPITDSRPVGSVDSAIPVPGGVRVQGWFADPDTRAPVTVLVKLDETTHVAMANLSRPDVGAAYPGFGSAVGFDLTVTGLGSGIHDVCVTGAEAAAGPGLVGQRRMPCGSVVLGSTLSVATTGAGVAGPAVGPPPGSPFARVDRDAGVSVPLRDGSTLWLFGDSMERNADGSLRYFVNNTAAWAASGRPTTTLDVAASDRPTQFATPTSEFPPCTNPTDTEAMWPMSAVAVPEGSNDRVLVYLANICLGPGPTVETRGVALAAWTYQPGTGASAPVVGTVLDQHLNSDADWAEAAMIGSDGLVYVYGCAGPDDGGWPTEYGPCTVGRVSSANAGDAGAYRYWNGSSWVAGLASATALNMPHGRNGVTNLPVGGVNVVHDAALGLYVMGYSPWPGYTTQLALRFSKSPQGPFTPPLVLSLPGCDDAAHGTGYHCYAGGVQPRWSGPGRIGVGWYDQLVSMPPLRGGYLSGSVPVEVLTS